MAIKLLTISEVAEILSVSEDAAYRLAREGILPVARIGRKIRVDEQKFQDFINNGGQALPGGWRKEAQ